MDLKNKPLGSTSTSMPTDSSTLASDPPAVSQPTGPLAPDPDQDSSLNTSSMAMPEGDEPTSKVAKTTSAPPSVDDMPLSKASPQTQDVTSPAASAPSATSGASDSFVRSSPTPSTSKVSPPMTGSTPSYTSPSDTESTADAGSDDEASDYPSMPDASESETPDETAGSL